MRLKGPPARTSRTKLHDEAVISPYWLLVRGVGLAQKGQLAALETRSENGRVRQDTGVLAARCDGGNLTFLGEADAPDQ